MTYRMNAAFIATLSVVALTLAANETFAKSGAALRSASTPSISRPSIAHSLRHHRRTNVGAFWPGAGDFSGGPSYGEPMANVAQPTSGDIHYTQTYDIPWDWAHRFPPAVTPSDRPYVSSCPAETVTVPGRYGTEQTVNITRCY
jgi:hypothetical protein